MDRLTVASADARVRVVEGSAPPSAEVVVELGTETYSLSTKVGRVLLERLADCLTSAERYEQGERYRQARRVAQLRGRGDAS
jgi:hypothetical protein